MIIFGDQSDPFFKASDTHGAFAPTTANDEIITLGHLCGEELDEISSEESAYEYFCDVADRFIGVPITAVAKVSDFAEREALFRTRIRAIYRAGVWGQFSLLCRGITTSYGLERCADVLNEVFCELEGEGREFNGFIEKGVCIDTPLTLYNLPRRSRFDFICFDVARLRYLCTGSNHSTHGENELLSQISKICRESDVRSIAINAPSIAEAENTVKLMSDLKINKIFFFSQADPNDKS